MNNVVGQAVDEFASATKGMNPNNSGAFSHTTSSTTASKKMSVNNIGGIELRQ